MSVGHQSPQSSMPALALKVVNTTTWGATPNTCTITDAYAHTNSGIEWWVTGTTPQSGNWSFNITQGQIVITSNSSEQSTLPISYVLY